MQKITTVLGLCLFAATACKPPADDKSSDGKSLDNLTRDEGAALTENSCGVAMSAERFEALSDRDKRKMQRIDAPDDELRRHAAGALAAVPRSIQALFFADEGSRIRVVEEPSSMCREASLTDGEQKFAGENTTSVNGCWVTRDGHLEIIVAADAKMIHHSLVRLFGYVFTQLVAGGLDEAAQGKSVELRKAVAKGVARFKKQRHELANALLADLGAKGEAVKNRFEKFAQDDALAFENFVVAEAIDSYYCSAKTRASFKDEFKLSYRAFTTGPTALAKDFGKAFDQRRLKH